MSRIFTGCMAIAALCLALASTVLAASAKPKSLGTYGGWRTYSYDDAGQTVCYMVENVNFQKYKKLHRGSSYIMITQRPAENSKDVFSFTTGYNLKPVTEVKVRIGTASFSLFTDKDSAWARDARTDRALAAAIRAGDFMTLTGRPAQKNFGPVTDKVSLTGSAAAYKAIGKACGLEAQITPKTKRMAKRK